MKKLMDAVKTHKSREELLNGWMSKALEALEKYPANGHAGNAIKYAELVLRHSDNIEQRLAADYIITLVNGQDPFIIASTLETIYDYE